MTCTWLILGPGGWSSKSQKLFVENFNTCTCFGHSVKNGLIRVQTCNLGFASQWLQWTQQSGVVTVYPILLLLSHIYIRLDALSFCMPPPWNGDGINIASVHDSICPAKRNGGGICVFLRCQVCFLIWHEINYANTKLVSTLFWPFPKMLEKTTLLMVK